MDLFSAVPAEMITPELANITVSRSARRKRISIRLKLDGSAELLAPAGASDKQLKKALEHFKPWLEKKLRELRDIPEEEKPHEFAFKVGGSFYFCGKLHTLKLAENDRSTLIKLQDDFLLTPTASSGQIKLMLEAFYRRHIRRIVTAKLEFYSTRFGFAVPEVSISGARRRFGSCNSKKELHFSWLLAMYPEELIELVVLHECAHFREMNHSAKFYRVLGEYLPDHRQRSKVLDKWSLKLSNYPR